MMFNAAGMALKPGVASDLDIQQWVEQHYGFVPHPFWISHCKTLYLDRTLSSAEPRRPWHECPPDKRLPIKEALHHFGVLPDDALIF
jgi:hypothetical protein